MREELEFPKYKLNLGGFTLKGLRFERISPPDKIFDDPPI